MHWFDLIGLDLMYWLMHWLDLIWFDLIWFNWLIWFELIWCIDWLIDWLIEFDLIWLIELIWFDVIWLNWFDLIWLIWLDFVPLCLNRKFQNPFDAQLGTYQPPIPNSSQASAWSYMYIGRRMRKTEVSPTGLGQNFARLNGWNIPLAKVVDLVPFGALSGPGAPDPDLARFSVRDGLATIFWT